MGSRKYLETTNQRRAVGKRLAPLDKKLRDVEWGEYRFDKIFRPITVKNKLTKDNLNTDGKVPVYSSESTNNGIIGYTDNRADFILNSKNPAYIIFGDHTRTFSIATESFCVTDNVKVLAPIKNLSIRVLLYIVLSWQRCIPNKGYSRHWSVAQKVLLRLPTKNGEIDFAFMESFIAELEAYLVASGLKNYALTKEEKEVLIEFEKQEFFSFKVINVFDVKNTGNILSRDIVENSGDTPYLGAGVENNSVSSYISYDKNFLDKGNCVFIGGKTFVVSYQEKDFYSNDSHNLVLYLKDVEKQTKLNYLYLTACVNKSLRHKYSWGDSISNKKIQTDTVTLPVKNDQPDYEKMGTFMSAIQKLVIKDVVLYADKKIAATKQVVHDKR